MRADGEFDCDVAIVGSGISGALIAWTLAQAGVKVIILESGPTVNRVQGLDHAFIPDDQCPLAPSLRRTAERIEARRHGRVGGLSGTVVELGDLEVAVAAAFGEWRRADAGAKGAVVIELQRNIGKDFFLQARLPFHGG